MGCVDTSSWYSSKSSLDGWILTVNEISFLCLLISVIICVTIESRCDLVWYPCSNKLWVTNNTFIFNQLKPLQLIPVICEQMDSYSDIHPLRYKFSFLSINDLLREIIRGFYEIRLLPKQLFQLVFTNAKVIKPKILD